MKGSRESELFLRYQHVLSQSKCSQHFMESESSSLCSQHLATCLYPGPAQSSASPPSFLFLSRLLIYIYIYIYIYTHTHTYTGCTRRNGQNFGRVFLMLNYTDITQNTYIQSWTVTEIMVIEKCPRNVRRPWRHTRPVRMPGNETPLANIVMQWPWQDNGPAAACVKYLET